MMQDLTTSHTNNDHDNIINSVSKYQDKSLHWGTYSMTSEAQRNSEHLFFLTLKLYIFFKLIKILVYFFTSKNLLWLTLKSRKIILRLCATLYFLILLISMVIKQHHVQCIFIYKHHLGTTMNNPKIKFIGDSWMEPSKLHQIVKILIFKHLNIK